jgi:hypothetical protein
VRVNLAETLFAAFIVSAQVLDLPPQAPPQPAKVAPDAGLAVSVTLEPDFSLELQALAPLPQSMPPPRTLPRPLTETVSW